MELDTLDYDHTMHENHSAADKKLYVRFFMEVMPDDIATAEAGMRKFRDAEMIQIMAPGDKRNIVVREVRHEDTTRFESLYQRFKATNESVPEGYPLAQWPMASRAMVEELKYLGFMTVEQVAGASDTAMTKSPGLRELQRRASAFIETQRQTAPVEKLQGLIEKQNEQIAAMQLQLAQLQTPVKAVEKSK